MLEKKAKNIKNQFSVIITGTNIEVSFDFLKI